MAEARLTVILSVIDRATNQLKSVNRSLAQNQDLLKKVSLAATAFTIASVIAIRSFARAALDSRQATLLLKTIIENTGASFEEFWPIIKKTIDNLKSNFSDEELLGAISALVLALGGNVPLAIRTLATAVDAAAAAGTSVEDMATQVGRFISGEIDTIRSLGITIDKDVTDPLERLAFLQSKVAGAAEASLDPFKQLSLALNDVKKTIGENLLPTLEPLLAKLSDLLKAVKDLPPGVQKFGADLLLVASGVAAVIAGLSTWLIISPKVLAAWGIFFGFATSPLGVTLIGIAAAILLVVDAQKKQKEIDDQQVELLRNLPKTAEEMAKAMEDLHKRTLSSWEGMNAGMASSTNINKPLILKSFNEIVDGMNLTETQKTQIKKSFEDMLAGVKTVTDANKPALIKSFSDIVMGMTTLTDEQKALIIKSLNDMLVGMKTSTDTQKPIIIKSFQDMWDIITGNFRTFVTDTTGRYDAMINDLIGLGNKARAAMGLSVSPPPVEFTEKGAIITGQVVPPPPVEGPPVPPGEGTTWGPGVPSETDPDKWASIVEGLYGLGGEREGWSWPTYPQLAEGGIVTTPTLAMIGERGPEAVIPLRGQKGGLTINFNGPVYGFEQFEKKIGQAVRDIASRGGFYGLKIGT